MSTLKILLLLITRLFILFLITLTSPSLLCMSLTCSESYKIRFSFRTRTGNLSFLTLDPLISLRGFTSPLTVLCGFSVPTLGSSIVHYHFQNSPLILPIPYFSLRHDKI